MEYRKETHFIVAYEGDKMKGKWDILTNTFIGVKGGVLKSRPASFTYDRTRDMNDVIGSAYRLATSYTDRWHPYTAERGQRLEEIISVGLRVPHSWSLWQNLCGDKTKLTKECVKYIMDNFGGVYDDESIASYRIYKTYKSVLDKCGEQKSWASCVLREVNSSVPSDFVMGMILRAIHEKVFYTYDGRHFGNLINTWCAMVNTLGDKLEVKHNILTNYTILQWIHNEYKMAHYDEALRKHNDKPWLYFEDETYIVRPLLNRAEFHNEAESQHNCVERMYMERVVEGHTHVVVVRKKENPNNSFITCEVDNRGIIRQYLYRCNNWVNNEKDCAFKELYQVHLLSSLEG